MHALPLGYANACAVPPFNVFLRCCLSELLFSHLPQVGFDADQGRYRVRLDDDGTIKRLQRKNLTPLTTVPGCAMTLGARAILEYQVYLCCSGSS